MPRSGSAVGCGPRSTSSAAVAGAPGPRSIGSTSRRSSRASVTVMSSSESGRTAVLGERSVATRRVSRTPRREPGNHLSAGSTSLMPNPRERSPIPSAAGGNWTPDPGLSTATRALWIRQRTGWERLQSHWRAKAPPGQSMGATYTKAVTSAAPRTVLDAFFPKQSTLAGLRLEGASQSTRKRALCPIPARPPRNLGSIPTTATRSRSRSARARRSRRARTAIARPTGGSCRLRGSEPTTRALVLITSDGGRTVPEE